MVLGTMTTLKSSLSCLFVSLCFFSCTTFRTAFGFFPCKQVGCGCRFTDGNDTYEITMKDIRKRGDEP